MYMTIWTAAYVQNDYSLSNEVIPIFFIPQIFANISTSRGIHYLQAGHKPGPGHGAPLRAHTEPVNTATEMLSSGWRGEAACLPSPFPILCPAYTICSPDWTLYFDSLVWHKAMQVLLFVFFWVVELRWFKYKAKAWVPVSLWDTELDCVVTKTWEMGGIFSFGVMKQLFDSPRLVKQALGAKGSE